MTRYMDSNTEKGKALTQKKYKKMQQRGQVGKAKTIQGAIDKSTTLLLQY